MKQFQGRVICPGTCEAEALVSHGGFNTLASYQMALMFHDKQVKCGDQNNPDLYKKPMIGKALCLPETIGSTTGGMVLYTACASGQQPACMLFSKHIDSLAASGAILASVWTDADMPVIDCLGDEFLAAVQTGQTVRVKLAAAGDIYYTTDGSAPTEESTPYTGAITVDKTTVLRAAAVEEGGAPSRALTLSFFIGEEHTLPVLSLVTDSLRRFSETYNGAVKYRECAANLSLLAPEGGFSIDCGVELKGRTSLFNPKKSLGVSFRGCYGAETLQYDIFGKGPAEFTELSIRAGQDYISTVFRNELMQELCAELDTTVTQRSRYCVLYINGEYWGIYCLKDDITRQFYANLTGTAKEDVTMLPSPVAQNTAVYTEALGLWQDTSLTRREAYERFCEAMDMDGFIDWVLLEGYCANVDIKSNLRYFRTGDGPWQIAFYDLDWAFQTRSNCFFDLIGSEQTAQIAPTIRWLFGIDDFKERLLTRYAELTETTLSDEHVTEKIDEFRALLAPEIARERVRWGGSEEGWNEQVDALRANIADDYAAHTVRNLCSILGMGEEERMEYFGF